MQHVLAVLVHVDVVEVLGPVDLPQQPPHLSGVLPWRTQCILSYKSSSILTVNHLIHGDIKFNPSAIQHLLSSPDTVRMKAILTLSLGEGGRVSLVTLTPVKWTSAQPGPGAGQQARSVLQPSVLLIIL